MALIKGFDRVGWSNMVCRACRVCVCARLRTPNIKKDVCGCVPILFFLGQIEYQLGAKGGARLQYQVTEDRMHGTWFTAYMCDVQSLAGLMEQAEKLWYWPLKAFDSSLWAWFMVWNFEWSFKGWHFNLFVGVFHPWFTSLFPFPYAGRHQLSTLPFSSPQQHFI